MSDDVHSVIRCPPACDSRSCTVKHDATLVQLLNLKAHNLETVYERHLFARFMTKLEKMNDWWLMTPLSDPVEEYRMPLLHWAFYLGKVDVIKYIFNEATVQSKSNLLRNANDKQQSRLSVLYDALLMGDTFGGNTPLHLCSQMLASSGNVGSGSEHLRCVNCLLDFIEDRQQRVEQSGLQWQEILNVRNRDGDMPLHIVCRSGASSSLIERFVVAGADVTFVSLGRPASHTAKRPRNSDAARVQNRTQTSHSSEEDKDIPTVVDNSFEVDSPAVSDQPFIKEVLSQFGIESPSYDGSGLEECLSECDASTLRSIRAAAVIGLAQLQEKSDVIEEALTDLEEAQRRVFADRQKAVDRLNASKTEKQLLREKLRKLERQLKANEGQIALLQSQRDDFIKCLTQVDAKDHVHH